MSSRWEAFKRTHEDELNALRPLLSITIYGSYVPKTEHNLLESLKHVLIQAGYSETKLVIDRQTNEDELEVSERCLLFSDVNFLIFTHRGMRHGIVDEVSFIAQDGRMRSRILRCKAFDQIKKGRSAIPRLTTRRMERRSIPRRQFKTIPELKRIVVEDAFLHLGDLREELSSRL